INHKIYTNDSLTIYVAAEPRPLDAERPITHLDDQVSRFCFRNVIPGRFSGRFQASHPATPNHTEIGPFRDDYLSRSRLSNVGGSCPEAGGLALSAARRVC